MSTTPTGRATAGPSGPACRVDPRTLGQEPDNHEPTEGEMAGMSERDRKREAWRRQLRLKEMKREQDRRTHRLERLNALQRKRAT